MVGTLVETISCYQQIIQVELKVTHGSLLRKRLRFLNLECLFAIMKVVVINNTTMLKDSIYIW